MATNTTAAKKLKLAKQGRRTRWAPFWTVPKIHGLGERAHPGAHTTRKRSWRRSNTKVTKFKKNLWRN